MAQIFKSHLKKISLLYIFLQSNKPLVGLYAITIWDHGVDSNRD